ncbi:MAG TPA: hypothetical protein VFG39_01180 [Balneolaceae bacterium]|nr:hypothetical protein [Balneolaceae bacterium]
MSKLIEFDGHTTLMGITRSGKTYAAKKSLAAQSCGVLFFNTQHEQMPGFTKADKSNTWEQIKALLDKGQKVAYFPAFEDELRDKELGYLIGKLHDGTEKNVIVAVDEVHLFGKQGQKDMIKVATTGLRFGVKGVWLSQRPANIDNTLMTQSNQFVIFKLNMEGAYLDRYRMPSEEIKNKIEQGGQYNYVVYDWDTLKGPFKA